MRRIVVVRGIGIRGIGIGIVIWQDRFERLRSIAIVDFRLRQLRGEQVLVQASGEGDDRSPIAAMDGSGTGSGRDDGDGGASPPAAVGE
jgi:hypothetical protein